MKPLRFVVVGNGFRARLYVRIAEKFPQLFQLQYILCRSEEKAREIAEKEQLPATASEKLCEEAGPDFVIVAVSFENVYEVTKKWAGKGFAVLCETPAATCTEALRDLWAMWEKGARIQVAEQYYRYPIMASGIRRLREGLIGEPYYVTLSLAHDYHGASLIRHMLYALQEKEGCHPCEEVKMWGEVRSFPVRETDSRYGHITDGSIVQRERTTVTMEFSSGKMAFYDFSPVQYRTLIRSRHLNVRAQDGEWNDTVIRYVTEDFHAAEEKLCPYLDMKYQEIFTDEMKELASFYRAPLIMDSSQDEFAVASMLYDMREYLRSGKEIYPFSEALQDAYMYTLIREAASHPGKVVRSEKMPWQRA